jgi:ABC-type amino acid transport system permease subunit
MIVNNSVHVSKETYLISIVEINELMFREKTVIAEKYSQLYYSS